MSSRPASQQQLQLCCRQILGCALRHAYIFCMLAATNNWFSCIFCRSFVMRHCREAAAWCVGAARAGQEGHVLADIWSICHQTQSLTHVCVSVVLPIAETLQDGASALLELAKKVNATSPVEAQPQQPQKSVYLVRGGRSRANKYNTVQHCALRGKGVRDVYAEQCLVRKKGEFVGCCCALCRSLLCSVAYITCIGCRL
jgi:hypothetical protein